MEQTPHEVEQTGVDSQSKNILPGPGKSGSLSSTPVQRPEIGGSEHLKAKFVTLTPVKANEPSHVRSRKEAAKLPEKYRTLSEFFDRMTSSLRLLNLRKRLPTFQNISCQVETLTGRKFSFRHLAQMKFILPEAVQTDKILIHHNKTMCMEPDIKVTLLFDVIQGHNEHSEYTALCRTFSSRLFDYISVHPEGSEVPEAELPEPFNQSSITNSKDFLAVELSSESLSNANEAELLNASHLHPSFCRRLSRKAVIAETEKTQPLASPVPPSSIRYDCMTSQVTGSRHQELPSDSCLEPIMHKSTVQHTSYLHSVSSSACESTPMKLSLETDALIVETPAQTTPKRSVPNDDKLKSVTSQKLIASNISAKRSLDFSNLEGEDYFLDSNAYDVEHSDVICCPSSHSGNTKGIFVEDNLTCCTAPLLKAEESSGCTTKDEFIDPGELISHQHMPNSLSDLVAAIHHIFQSAHCSSITKAELVHKIMMNSLDVVESREIEEQIELLEKQVPDWISRKVAPSGDLLYSIKKVSDVNSICEKLI